MLAMNLLVLTALVAPSHAGTPGEDELHEMFGHFKTNWGKTYADEEAEKRFAQFKKNIGSAIDLNRKHGVNCSWSKHVFLSSSGADCPYGVTEFSDLHEDEFKARMLGYKLRNTTDRSLRTMAPSEYVKGQDVNQKDWRDIEGVVTPIKNQNPCGVCWSFSAASTMESAYAIKYQTSAPILSPEEIVECDGTHHCNDQTSGGNFGQAWSYLQQNGGLATADDYPTTCCGPSPTGIGQCYSATPKVAVTGYSNGPQNEDDLAAAVAAQGPFSIAVAAGSWQHWTGGTQVMTQCDGDIDHAVSVVGFDKTGDTPYWIVRNQWGTDWGDAGYIYLQMGQNTCQLTAEPMIVQVADAAEAQEVVV